MDYLSEPDVRILGGVDKVKYQIEYCNMVDCLDPLVRVNENDLDTYEKRQKIIDQYFSNDHKLRRTGSILTERSKLVMIGILEHDARQLRLKNKRKFEE